MKKTFCRFGDNPFKSPNLLVIAGLVCVAFVSSSDAQSPTDTFIRLHCRRVEATPVLTKPQTQSAQPIKLFDRIGTPILSSRRGVVRSHVRAMAQTEGEAKRVARRDAYLVAVEHVMPFADTQEVKALRHQVGLAVADLKSAKAEVIACRKVAQGYEAEAEVTRPSNELLADFREVGLSNNRALVYLQTKTAVAGSDSPAAVEEEAIEGALTDGGFTVLDRKYLARQNTERLLTDLGSELPAEAVKQAGVASLCGIVVLGTVDVIPSQSTEGIISCTASLRVRVLNGASGQVILTRRYTEKGFGLGELQAGQAALENLTKKATADLPAAISGQLQTRRTTIVFENGSVDVVADIESTLNKMSGVKKVDRETTSGQTRLVVLTTEKPAFLGINLSQVAGVKSVDFGVGTPTKENP